MAFPTEKVSDNDYRQLRLSPGASQAEVKKAYRNLVKRWHPDFFHQRSSYERQQAEERFKEITGAYRRISLSWTSQEEIYQRSSARAPKEEAKPASKAETKKSAAGSNNFYKSPEHRQSYRRSARFWRFPDLDFRSFTRFFGERIRRVHLKWDQRSVGALLFVLLFLTFFGLTSIPIRTWFSGHSELRTPVTGSRPQAIVPAQPPEPPQADSSGALVPEATPSERGTTPHRPHTLPPPPPRGHMKSHFTLGSTQAEVLRIQGAPNRVHGQTWIYGLSEIQFKDGQVWRYNNFDGSLRVKVLPLPVPKGERPSYFTLGSNRNDILLVQGTPTRVESNKWYYGFSEIRFKNGLVEEYDNYFGDLNIRILPSNISPAALRKGFFTIGSSMDDVLVVQGTPTSIQGSYWFYQSSNILFRDKKVQYVVNSGGNLRFVPPEDLAKPADDAGW